MTTVKMGRMRATAQKAAEFYPVNLLNYVLGVVGHCSCLRLYDVDKFNEILTSLSPQQRQIIELAFKEGLLTKDVADRLGKSVVYIQEEEQKAVKYLGLMVKNGACANDNAG